MQEKGFKATTTDEIVAQAGVSPRTLFNYFQGKEDAVLGLRTPAMTEEILRRDSEREDLYIFERITHLLLDIVLESVQGPPYDQVVELVSAYPELRFRLRTHNLACESVLADFLRTIDWKEFARQGRRGPFIYFTPDSSDPGDHPTHYDEDLVQGGVCIASAIWRYLDYTKRLPLGDTRDQKVAQAVHNFRHLLRED